MERKFNHLSKEQVVNPLEGLRKEIDRIDDQILNLLAKRMNVAKKIGEHKKESSVSPLDTNRWSDVINSRITKGEDLGLDGVFVVSIYNSIHEESLNIQKNMRDETKKQK